jgi:hypothetical protein
MTSYRYSHVALVRAPKAKLNRRKRYVLGRTLRPIVGRPTLQEMLEAMPLLDDDELAQIAEISIDLMDTRDGDPDLEDGHDREAFQGDDQGDDQGDRAWQEWHTLHRSQKRGRHAVAGHEDAEDDDPSGQYDEDYYTGPLRRDRRDGAGCSISDPGGGNVEDELQAGAGQDYYRMPPRYGVDQTLKPLNHIEILRQHNRDMGYTNV